MRTTYILLIIAFGLWSWFLSTRSNARTTSDQLTRIQTDSVDFKTQVQPLLVKNCSPCHFPGGKMYEKLPFDKGETIVNHETGVFKRIKKENEARLVKQYIEENKK
jgi:hypothetical protein